MRLICCKVQNQRLNIESDTQKCGAEKTIGYVHVKFEFETDDWNDTVKTAHFQFGENGEPVSNILIDNECEVPPEVLDRDGHVFFSVAGEREAYRITTGREYFKTGMTIYSGHPSEPPTPDQYDQMIGIMQRTEEIAQSVREDADNGVFDGDPGEPGKDYEHSEEFATLSEQVRQDANKAEDSARRAEDAAEKAESAGRVNLEEIAKLAIKEDTETAKLLHIQDSAEFPVQDFVLEGGGRNRIVQKE